MAIAIPELVRALADGRFHTGDELGELFGVSRAAIWKAIKKFEDLNLDVHSVRRKGYRLAEPLVLLDDQQIINNLEQHHPGSIKELELLLSVDSTNSHAMRRLTQGTLSLLSGQTYICVAEQQTAGKGRRGRHWVSPFGKNYYLTLVREFESGAAGLDGLSLVTGIALVQALNRQGFTGMELKWPNDVLWQGRKLGGILLEVTGDLTGSCQVIMGLGVNLQQSPLGMASVTQPWVDLMEMGFEMTRRNTLLACIINTLLDALNIFQARGFEPFRQAWQQLDSTFGKQIELLLPSGNISGYACGVDDNGALLVETSTGIQKFNGGEVSLKKSGLSQPQ